MGLTRQKLIIKETHRTKKKAEVDFLIDSGAVYSLAPSKVLRTLGLRPHRTVEFTLADGRIITRQVGDAYFEYRGTGGAAPIIFGETDDEALLGATALESLGLVLDPFKRRLLPMRLLLASSRLGR